MLIELVPECEVFVLGTCKMWEI